jgi:hypothetical protein
VKGRFTVLPAGLAVLLGLVACTSSTPGTGTVAPPVSSPISSAPTTAAGASLATIQPCDLLTSTDVSQHHLNSDGPTTGNGARSCSWSDDSYDDGLGYELGVDIRDSQGINDYNGEGFSVSDATIGRHKAILARGTADDLCDITIGVTQTSRVDISVNTGAADVNQSCTLVERYAQLIEPKLP